MTKVKPAIERKVESIAREIIRDSGLELVDVEYTREHSWYLRVFIDKEGGIEFDDCQFVSEKLGQILDQQDFIKEQYYLEVSSPGLDRPLKKPADYVRCAGKQVEVHLYAPLDGRKMFTGRLLGLADGIVSVDVNGKEMTFPVDKLAQVRLHIQF